MRRIGTLTSALTLLALGLLLLADVIWQRSYFAGGLYFWPLILVGIGGELLYSWLAIRRKQLPEVIRLDGRSLALLFLVGVFSINFYLSAPSAAEGVVSEKAPAEPLFNVTKTELSLPTQVVTLRPETKKVVIQNPMGGVEIIGTTGEQMKIESRANVESANGISTQMAALELTPTVDYGEKMSVTVHQPLRGETSAVTSGKIDLRIELPRGYELAVHSGRGDVSIKQYQGTVNIWANAGRAVVEELTGNLGIVNLNGAASAKNVQGNINVSTRQGGVTAQGIEGHAHINSESGNCTISNVSGRLDLVANLGEVVIESVRGDIEAKSKSGLLKVTSPGANLLLTVKNGNIKVDGKPAGSWNLSTTEGKVQMGLPKDSDISFLGETSGGVIKGPTKQSQNGGTKQGAHITEIMGLGTHPVTVRSDNGGIFVDIK